MSENGDHATTSSTLPRPRRDPRLDSPQRIRREVVRLYWSARHGEIDSGDAARLGSLLSLAASLLRDSELEGRLLALEAVVR